jgi:hypothetical protein
LLERERISEVALSPKNPAHTNSDHPTLLRYDNGRDIPIFWSAREFALQDRMLRRSIAEALRRSVLHVED